MVKKLHKHMTPHIYQLSKEGLVTLRRQLELFTQEYNDLRSKFMELRQIKDAEEFDLVDESIRLSYLERKIESLRHVLAHSKVTAAAQRANVVQLGSKVRLEQDGKKLECMLVSALEADPSEGKISDQSPLGRALLGKMLNTIVEVVAPRSKILYRIVGIDS